MKKENLAKLQRDNLLHKLFDKTKKVLNNNLAVKVQILMELSIIVAKTPTYYTSHCTLSTKRSLGQPIPKKAFSKI